MFTSNNKLFKVMLITIIIGVLTTIVFVALFDFNDVERSTLMVFGPWTVYVLEYLIIGYGFKWKFGKETRWIATLCITPLMFEILIACIISLLEKDLLIFANFIKWYQMIGITISITIFEYHLLNSAKK